MTQPENGIEPLRFSLRQRVSQGVAILTARQVAMKLTGLLSTLVLARELGVEGFGSFAVGLTVVSTLTILSDGGLSVGLVRRQAEPTRDELATMTAFQLAALVAGAAVAAALIPVTGEPGAVAAVMLAPLPLLAYRTAAFVRLERELAYPALARVEVAEQGSFQLTSIALALLGFGPVAVALATIPRAVLGTVLMVRAGGVGWLRPRWRWREAADLVRFGVVFQGVTLMTLARDQGVNFGVLGIAGVETFAVWTIAWRLVQIPFLLFAALWRVSFPAVAAKIRDDEDPLPSLQKGLGLTSLAVLLLLSPLIAGAPGLVPALFGDGFSDAAEAVIPIALALQLTGPISVASVGYLLAVDAVTRVYAVEVCTSLPVVAISLALVDGHGVLAIGIGYAVGGIAQAAAFLDAMRREAGIRLRPPWQDVPALIFAAGVGIGAYALLGETAAAAVLAALLAAAVSVSIVFVTARERGRTALALGAVAVKPAPTTEVGSREP